MSTRGAQVTGRDVVLLQTVASLRVLTTRQVQRLLFPSEQVALRRLRRLAEAGLIRLERSTVSPHRVVTLTSAGQVKAGIESPSSNALRARHSLFLQHQLGVNDFRLALGQACASRADVDLVGFIADTNGSGGPAEPGPGRVLADVLGTNADHVPDGMFALRRGDRCALFFFEFDRGTEVIGNTERGLGRIIRAYLASFAGRSYGRAAGLLSVLSGFLGFRVLVVTTTPARIANIRTQWASESGPMAAGKRFVWLATAAVLESKDILGEAWLPLDRTDPRTYTMLGEQK